MNAFAHLLSIIRRFPGLVKNKSRNFRKFLQDIPKKLQKLVDKSCFQVYDAKQEIKGVLERKGGKMPVLFSGT